MKHSISEKPDVKVSLSSFAQLFFPLLFFHDLSVFTHSCLHLPNVWSAQLLTGEEMGAQMILSSCPTVPQLSLTALHTKDQLS